RPVGTPRRFAMSSMRVIAQNLAAGFLAGPWSLDSLVRRGARACGRRERWLRPLVRRVLAAFASPHRLPQDALARFICQDQGVSTAWPGSCRERQSLLREVFWATPRMPPAPGPPASWPVPALPTFGALAEWLGLSPTELAWFADCHGREGKVPPGP